MAKLLRRSALVQLPQGGLLCLAGWTNLADRKRGAVSFDLSSHACAAYPALYSTSFPDPTGCLLAARGSPPHLVACGGVL